ncbi:Hypothetical predicted protein [Olea europaea subsp. europaea]|uniref:Uncharacterized protein n=1 Tax=Olea europaea subsp. europaea TaxID=158383 RepID=A0A8S0UFJ8_OLEEU|nr:Hypothetical predicted protein [Olea europaea subsp. europaea]
MKQFAPMLLITDGRLGDSNVHIDDDDFVDPSPRWNGTSIDRDSPSGECKLADTTDWRTSDSEDQLSNNASCSSFIYHVTSPFSVMIFRSHKYTQATNVEKIVDSKGKGKVESMGAVEFPCSLELPYFDLDLGFTQPSQFDTMTSKEVQMQVNSVISNVLKETESNEQEPHQVLDCRLRGLQSQLKRFSVLMLLKL